MFLVVAIVSRSTTAREETVIEELEECTDMWLISVGDEQFFVLCKICGIIDARLSSPRLKIFVGGKKESRLHGYSTTEHNMIDTWILTKIAEREIDPGVTLVKPHSFDIVLGFATEPLTVSELAPLRVAFII
jgi:hypothetical protein